LEFDNTGSYQQYVGLQTPPRTLTMEETLNFPMLEEKMEERREQNMSQNQGHRYMPNG
jgi:hypothetical protein